MPKLFELNKKKSPKLDFFWIIDVPMKDGKPDNNALKVGMKTTISYLNEDILVQVIKNEINEKIIEKYKNGKSVKRCIRLKVKFVNFYASEEIKQFQDQQIDIKELIPTIGKDIKDFQLEIPSKKTKKNIAWGCGKLVLGLGYLVGGTVIAGPILVAAALNAVTSIVSYLPMKAWVGVFGKSGKAWTKNGARKLFVKNLFQDNEVKAIDAIHIIIAGKINKDAFGKKNEKVSIGKKYFGDDGHNSDYEKLLKRLKKYISPSITDEGGEFKQKYNIFFHYTSKNNQVDLYSMEKINIENSIPLIKTDEKIKQLCNDSCMMNLIEEAREAKIDNPCGTTFCYKSVEDADAGRRSTQKISNSFYLSKNPDTSMIIEPGKKIVFEPDFIGDAENSANVIQLSGTSKIPGIITLKTKLPNAKNIFKQFFNALFEPSKFKGEGKGGKLIFNRICVDYEIKDTLIPILRNLKKENVVFDNVTIINSEVISIYNILYILRNSQFKFKSLNISGIEDSNKANLEEKENIKEANRIKNAFDAHRAEIAEENKIREALGDEFMPKSGGQQLINFETGQINETLIAKIKDENQYILKAIKFGYTHDFDKISKLDIYDNLRKILNPEQKKELNDDFKKMFGMRVIFWVREKRPGRLTTLRKKIRLRFYSEWDCPKSHPPELGPSHEWKYMKDWKIKLEMSVEQLLNLFDHLIHTHVSTLRSSEGSSGYAVKFRHKLRSYYRKIWSTTSPRFYTATPIPGTRQDGTFYRSYNQAKREIITHDRGVLTRYSSKACAGFERVGCDIVAISGLEWLFGKDGLYVDLPTTEGGDSHFQLCSKRWVNNLIDTKTHNWKDNGIPWSDLNGNRFAYKNKRNNYNTKPPIDNDVSSSYPGEDSSAWDTTVAFKARKKANDKLNLQLEENYCCPTGNDEYYLTDKLYKRIDAKNRRRQEGKKIRKKAKNKGTNKSSELEKNPNLTPVSVVTEEKDEEENEHALVFTEDTDNQMVGGNKKRDDMMGPPSIGAGEINKIATILGSKKGSNPNRKTKKEEDVSEGFDSEGFDSEGFDGLLIMNALEFEDNSISLPIKFESNNMIINAMKEVNRLREEVGKSYLIIDFQSPDKKTTKMDNALTQSTVLFNQLRSETGISRFEKALEQVKLQLKQENLEKIKFKNESGVTILDQLKSILKEKKELNESQSKFKKAFMDIKELFITKNMVTKQILIESYKEKVQTLLEKLEVIKRGKTDDRKKAEERLKHGKDLQERFINIERKYNNFKEGSYSAPQSGGGWNPVEANRRRKARNKLALEEKEQNKKKIESEKAQEIKDMAGSQLFRMLIGYLEDGEEEKLDDDLNRMLRDKSLDPEALARGYDDFEISVTMVEINTKNPVMSKLKKIGNDTGIKEILMCYGDDKESACWVYPSWPDKVSKKFSDVIKSNKPLIIKFTQPTSQKKKQDYKDLMTRKAQQKGLELKDLYKLNYTNKTGKKINGPKGGVNPDKIDILHPKYLKMLNVECLYSDGIDPNETVRLYLFDKYDQDDFEDSRHKDIVRIMVEQPKTQTITIEQIKQNLTYVIQNNIILPNKVDLLFSYKELAISQGKTDISKLMNKLKHIYKYTSIYSSSDSYQLKHMIFKTNQDDWDVFYNEGKISTLPLEIDKRKLDKMFISVVNSSGSNNTLRFNDKYGTIFYNFSKLKNVPVVDANIKNINKVLLDKFNDYWSNVSNASNIFSLKFEGQLSNVYILTINKLDELIKGVKYEKSLEKDQEDTEAKEKEQKDIEKEDQENIDKELGKMADDEKEKTDKAEDEEKEEEAFRIAQMTEGKEDEENAEMEAKNALAVGKAGEAQREAGEAEKAAETAQGKAGEAKTEADTAEGAATKAKTDADTAEGAAETAGEAAETAGEAAKEAQGEADTAEGAATAAEKESDKADKAEKAETAAETAAKKKADVAKKEAVKAEEEEAKVAAGEGENTAASQPGVAAPGMGERLLLGTQGEHDALVEAAEKKSEPPSSHQASSNERQQPVHQPPQQPGETKTGSTTTTNEGSALPPMDPHSGSRTLFEKQRT